MQNSKPSCFVGFDTSNYTTSAAVCTADGEVVANLKVPLPVSEGERGLRQSDAVFAHTKNLPGICDRLSEALSGYTVAAVGVSSRPRSADGSYMPCFLTGIAAAKAFAAQNKLPVLEFSHQDGHIAAAYYSAGADFTADFAAFHVSGGTTELLFVRQNDISFTVEQIGGSSDLHAGQCLDRVGVAMGMKFPCGAEMDKLALLNDSRLPTVRVSVNGLYCNLSGLENLALKLYRDTQNTSLVSAFTFEYIAGTLGSMTDAVRQMYPGIPVLYAGGVMSSKYISKRLERNNVYFAKPEFSADNAAGIALLCRKKYQRDN